MLMWWPLLSLLARKSAPALSGRASSQYAADVWEATMVGSLPSRSNMILVRSSRPVLVDCYG